MTESIVVVGASHAALQAIDTLHRDGHPGPIVLVGDEPHLPYNRPPLSKKFLTGELESERLLLRSPHFYENAHVETRLGVLMGSRVVVSVTDNRHTMVSSRRLGDRAELRLHHMFLDADDGAIRALARYLTRSDRRASERLDEYIEANQHRIRKAQPRPARLRTRGRYHDLGDIFDGLNELHFDGQVTGVNEAFSRVFGLGEDRVVGRSLAEAGLWVADKQRLQVEAALERQGYVLGVEVCLRHESGANLDCLVSAERITINETAFVLLVLQDITERKHTERELFDAIETVMADTSWFSRGLIEKLANLRRPGREAGDAAAPNLTVRERQILNLICSGLSDDAIARKLGLSRNTVRNHGAALYRKIGIHKRSEAVVWGRENGFPLNISDG